MNDESDNIWFNMTTLIKHGTMDDVFILTKLPKEEVQNILFAQSCVPRIKEFLYDLRKDGENLTSPYFTNFEDLLSKMVYFVTLSDHPEPLKCEGIPVKTSQKYLRELKIIDLLVDILIYPFEPKEEGGQPAYDLKNLTQNSPMTKICQLIYRIMKHCARDCESNKFYVAQWISHLFHQSMMTDDYNDLKAEFTITELLANNKKLLDKQINT